MPSRKKITLSGDSLVAEIERAAEGVIYVSEIDAGFEALLIPSAGKVSTKDKIASRFGWKVKVAEEVSFKDFFERLTRHREWHGERERRRAEKFARLQRILKENLKDLRVFRFGRIQLNIVVAGLDAEGNIAGVHTTAVET